MFAFKPLPLLALSFFASGLIACGSQTLKTPSSPNAKANALYDAQFEERVSLSPQWQAYLGRKTDQDRWDPVTEENARLWKHTREQQLNKLAQLNVSELSGQTLLSYQLLSAELQNAIADYQWRHYGYPVNQMFGKHSMVPSLLINQHRMQTEQDAKNYIARLAAIPALFEQVVADLERRREIGVVVPRFAFSHVLRDCGNLLAGYPFDEDREQPSTLLADFTQKVTALEIGSDKKQALIEQAEAALRSKVGPAYHHLVGYLSQLRESAPTRIGVWQLPNGDNYYNHQLARITTTDLTANEIHAIGLREVERIHTAMQHIMQQVEFDGDLAAFFDFMRSDPQFTYANTTAGKQQYLAETQAYINGMQNKLATVFNVLPKAELRVKAVEPFREQSAGKAFYQQPSADGSRPGIYYVNLHDMQNMPWYQMEALAYHEALPGHHLQLSIAQELKGLPKFRLYGHYTAYSEGWGLYAEYLPKEMGFYQNPYSDFGRLAMELWRATRLVVDTGIHHKRWTKQQAVDYLVNNTPNARTDIERAVERYAVMPGQATAYMVGMLKILELRNRAETQLGDKFDIRDLHDIILKNGALPLNVLEQQVEQWIEAESALL
ncbi:MAG TPA: DUF885 domain-containing protein [Marinagarivorans sp.]